MSFFARLHFLERGGVFYLAKVRMSESLKLFPAFIAFTIFLFSFCPASLAKTYKWEDFTKPYKEKIKVSAPWVQNIEVYLPDIIINNFEKIPLIITTYDADPAENTFFTVNGQSRFRPYRFSGRDEFEWSNTINIETKDLKPGLNTLHFENMGTGWEYYIYELKFDLPNIKSFQVSDAKKKSQTKPPRQQAQPTAKKDQNDTLPIVAAKDTATQDTPAEHPTMIGARWALVIGISKYQDTRIPSLRYAAVDAKLLHDWLISPEGGQYAPSRVKLLIDKQATGNRMKKALYEWLGQAIEEDIVTIFFAGHGSPQSPDNPDNLFLLTHDVQYDSVATTGFPMWDIETALKRFIKAKKVIVIADACHAGGVGQAFDVARRAGRGINVVPITSNLQNLSQIGDGVCIISASDDNQFSQESKKWGGGHGVFTYYLLEGLKGGADYNKNKRVSLGEIIPYLSEQVRRATRNAQTPTVAGRFDPALTIGN